MVTALASHRRSPKPNFFANRADRFATALSVAMMTTGKAAVYPEVGRFLQVPRRIGKEASKVA